MSRRSVIAVFAILSLSLFVGSAWAGQNAWTGTGPDGGPIRSVLVDPAGSGTVYVGTGGSGVFKTTNGGTTWVQLDPTGDLATKTVRSLVFGATTAIIYAGADNSVTSATGVFQSIDSGATWTPIGTAATQLSNRKVQSLAYDSTTDTLYAGTREENPVIGGVFKRVAGATWVQINNGLGTGMPNTQSSRRVQALAIDPRLDPPAVYAGTQGAGAFRTINGGATWTAVGSPNPNQGFSSACLLLPEIESLAIDPNVALAGDGTWARLYAGVRGQVGNGGCDPIPPGGDNGQGAGFFMFAFPEWDRRMNGMATLNGQPFLPTLTLNVWSVVTNTLPTLPVPTTHIYIGTDQGVFRSTNGSGSWNLMPSTLAGGFMGLGVRALGLDPTAGVTLYAGTNGRGVFKRLPPNDAPGVQIQVWCGPGSPAPCAPNSGLTALRAQSAAMGLRGGAPAVFAGLVGGGVITSADNGATWQNTPDPEAVARSVFAFAVDPTDQSVVYAATGQGVILTENGGDSWAVKSAGLPTDPPLNVSGPGPFRMVRSILVDPANPLVLYAGVKPLSTLMPGGVYGSVNGGESWTALNTGLPAAAQTGTSIVSAFAVDHGSATGSWGTVYAAIAATEGNVCTATTCGVFKSTNGGGSWTSLGSLGIALPQDLSFSTLALDPLTPATLYAGTSTGKVFKIAIGSTNWQALGNNLPVLPVTGLVIQLGAPSKLIASLAGGGVFTIPATGSSSWTALNTDLPLLDVAGLGFDPQGEGTLYAATLGRGIFDYEFTSGVALPQVFIESPVPPTFDTGTSPVILSGSAGGTGIFRVFWTTNRGHAGVAQLVPPNWNTNAVPVPLEVGPNVITVTAVDGTFHQGSATLTVNLEATPVIFVSPPSLSLAFGTVAVGGTSPVQTVTVRNDGLANLVLGVLSLGGANPGQFTKTTVLDLCTSATLAPTQTCTVGIRFKPTSPGPQNATLTIPSNDPDSNPVTVTLGGTGSGGGVPVISVTPATLSIAFGTVAVGGTSAAQTVTVRNDGTANLVLATLALGGTDAGQFTKTTVLDKCTNVTLAPTQTCTVGLRFKPTSSGVKNATLAIPSNDPGAPTVTVTLSGTGSGGPAPVIFVSPPSLSLAFGTVTVGTTSPAQTVTVRNDGTANLVLGALALGGANPGQFTKTTVLDHCTNVTLTPTQTCTVGIRFKPTSPDPQNATLAIPSNDPVTPSVTVTLSGTGG